MGSLALNRTSSLNSRALASDTLHRHQDDLHSSFITPTDYAGAHIVRERDVLDGPLTKLIQQGRPVGSIMGAF